MTKKVKRTISLIIAAIMLLSTMSVLAFADNVPHVCVAGKEKEDVTQYAQPTCAKAGQKVYVVKCTICDKILKSRVEPLDKLTSHVLPDEPAGIQNYKAPTCTTGGSYDAVFFCKICGKKVTEKKYIARDELAHVAAPAVIDQDKCTHCGTCAEKCPKKAIRHVPKKRPVAKPKAS